MLKKLRRLVYPLLLNTRWHEGTRGTKFVWQRYVPESDSWEVKEMTESEKDEAYAWWAIK